MESTTERKKENPSKIKKLIGVMSGKGGVGKSTVSLLLAKALQLTAKNVGIFDADITGPSIPRLLGLENERIESDGELIKPYITNDGLRMLSINMLLETEDTPIIWRGPLLAKTVVQFWEETLWGDLDYLVVDMPPGTADIPLSIMQSLPVDGLVFVTTPQEMVSVIVAKSLNMARSMNIPMLGIIENMSWLKCPKCGETIPLFGDESAERLSDENMIPILAKLPFIQGSKVFKAPEIAQSMIEAARQITETLNRIGA